MKKNEIYFSVDIETDGRIPYNNSMLSLGAVALDKSGKILGKFSANLDLLPNAKQDADTMKWWSENQKAYDKTRENTQDPKQAMTNFVEWVESFDGKPVCVAFPGRV